MTHAVTASGGARPSPLRRALRTFLHAVLLLACAFVLYVASVGGLLALVLALFVAGAIALAAYRWPTGATLAMLVIVPMSRSVSFVAFATSRSALVLHASQLLKDELLIAVLLGVLNLAFLRRRWPRVHLIDLAVAAYLAVTLVYVAYPGVDHSSGSVFARFLAWRQDGFYVLAYFVGRGITLRRADLTRALGIAGTMSVAVAVFAVFEFAAPGLSNGLLNKLGFSGFMAAIGTPHEVLAVRSRGIGAADLARASSFFFADLGLAYYQLVVIPVAAGLFVFSRGRLHRRAAHAGFVLLMIGVLGLTVTRSAIAVAGLGLVVVLLLRPSYLHAAAILLGAGALLLAFMLVEGIRPDGLLALGSLNEGSAQSHLALLHEALATLQQFPGGLGLGNGSHVANQLATFGVMLPVSAAESWYLQLGLEMGVLGIAAFTVALLSATFFAMANHFRVQDDLLRALTLGTAALGASLIAISVVQPVWAAVHVPFFFWLLVGIAVRAPVLDRQWRASGESPVPPPRASAPG